MSGWKQFLLSIAVIGLIGLLWVSYFPGARELVERQQLYQALFSGGSKAAEGADGAKPAAGAPSAGARPQGPGGNGRGARIASVVTRPAAVETINTRISALGTGLALHSVTVLPRASGRLTDVLVQAGQVVQAGDVLARLNADRETIAFDKARLALEDARATLVRTQALVQANSVSATQLQQVQLAVDNADLGLRSAEVDLQNRNIVAPINGTVGLIQASVGNEVTGSSVIATIEDDSAILVNFWLPEVLVGAVQVGDPATAIPVARPDVFIPARVVGIDNRVDAASGTYEVQARLENAGGDLRPGMSFTVSMSFPGESYLGVDPLSILWGSDGAYVWRVVDDKVEKAPVRIIQRNSETVLVAGDISEGDLIVTEGLDGLIPGAAVKIPGQKDASADSSVIPAHRTGSGVQKDGKAADGVVAAQPAAVAGN